MEGLKHIRVGDEADNFEETTSNTQDSMEGGGSDKGDKPASTTAGAGAPTESSGQGGSRDQDTSSGDSLGDSPGGQGSGSTRFVEFPELEDGYEPVYYVRNDVGTIDYKTADGISVKSIYWQTVDEASLGNATSKSDDFTATGEFRDVSASQIVLSLIGEDLKKYYGKPMELLVDWESDDDKFTGNTRSLYFSVSDTQNATLEREIRSMASRETQLETTTAATSAATASPSNSSKDDKDSSGGGGLSTGAKAGIAVGAVIGGLLLIGALAFFLLRRRRRSKQAGEDYTSQQAYTVDKETHGRATDSPNSPYSDENQVQPVALQNISRDHGDHDEQTARGTPTPSAAPRQSTGSRGAPTPQGMSSNVAHLVEDGMTPEEIRRLEQEERELDDEIERAARR